MLFGIQLSQDVKLGNISHSLREKIAMIWTEKRLSRNLKNAEVLAAVDLIRKHTQGRGIWTVDRGDDRKKLLEPLLDRTERFIIRSTGKRTVIDRRKLQASVAEVAGRCRLRHQARIIKVQDGQEKVYNLRYGAEPSSSSWEGW
jgi:hypothetical protein